MVRGRPPNARREAAKVGASPLSGPFVLVHGLGVSRRYFEPLVRSLGRDGRVFAPDLPRERAIGELADWLARWTDEARVGTAVYVANSMGCQVAVELAVRRRERVAALVLVGPTVDPRGRTLVEQGVRLARAAVHEPPALLWTVAADYVRSGPLRTVRWARRMLEHRIEERLPLVVAPTLVVRGEHDPIVPRAWAERVASLAPRGSFAEIAGAAHAAHFTHPEQVRALANDFITRSQQDAG